MRDEHFEWDDEKARLNAANHEVTFEEATEVFGPGEAFVRYDREHSLVEDRFMIIGHSARGRILAVWHIATAACESSAHASRRQQNEEP